MRRQKFLSHVLVMASEPTKVPYERVLWDIDDEGTEGDANAFHEEVPDTEQVISR